MSAEKYKMFKQFMHNELGITKEQYINFIRTFHPQSQWKPSDEQIECLGYAIENAEKDWSPLTNNRTYLTLKALREQLLELRGSKV